MIRSQVQAMVMLIGLTACEPNITRDPEQPTQEDLSQKLKEADEALARLRAEKALAASEPEPSPEVAISEPPELCWQDYCPCEDPITSLDTTVCRNARAGIEMSDDQWSIAAGARDMKIEGDRLTAEMDDIVADARRERSELYSAE